MEAQEQLQRLAAALDELVELFGLTEWSVEAAAEVTHPLACGITH